MKRSDRDQRDAPVAAPSHDTPVASPSPLDRCYPPGLRQAEDRELRVRRDSARVDPGAAQVGLALSGGGIRSATFSLGLVQSLSSAKLLGKIDYLSTVSGGGFFGSFLGALFVRATPPGVDRVQKELSNCGSWSVRWLRENGRYLSPNGAGDAWLAAAVLLRNWVAVHVVLLTFQAMLFFAATMLRALAWDLGGVGATPFHEKLFWPASAADPQAAFTWWWSPFLLLPALTFALVMVPTGALYWVTQFKSLMNEARASRLRNGLSRALTGGLIVTLALAAFALIDSAGQTIYLALARNASHFGRNWAGAASLGVLVFGAAQRIMTVLDRMPKHRAIKVPVNLLALLAAVAWAILIAVGLAVLAHFIAWQGRDPFAEPDAQRMSLYPIGGALAAAVILSIWFSRTFGFVNLSSQQQLYAARLTRAYLGASNAKRREDGIYNITNVVPGDEVRMAEYRPQQNGGPLHLINVTLNETVSGKSQVEQRDRKGISMAIGPCGLSVGVMSHALWTKDTSHIEPLVLGDDMFHAFEATAASRAPGGTTTARPGQTVEALQLGNWLAISGAAFTTGLGSGTSLGLSMLLGLANVRLGYWWDSFISPGRRKHCSKPSPTTVLGRWFGKLFPVQSCFMDELLARFHGPMRRRWYLSDGGHFENTACYELIRRRVPLIIASDAGRDLNYDFTDLANLARKARIDFNAEIEFLRPRAGGMGSAGIPALEDIVHPALLGVIGGPEDFVPTASGARRGKKHALLARVRYLDPHVDGETNPCSYILFVKPSLTGDEPADVQQYQSQQPDFPQESTMDQYFDEAQWESYRRLGEHIGSLLFAPQRQGPEEKWLPRDMHAPVGVGSR